MSQEGLDQDRQQVGSKPISTRQPAASATPRGDQRRRGEQPEASELAQALQTLVVDQSAMPEDAARDLVRLLGHSLAVPTIGGRRQAQLGLLIDLAAAGTGEFITSTAYEEARRERRRQGEEWPTASALSRAFGHWLKAVGAASRYWFEGGQGRVPASYAHARRFQRYRPQEIVSALIEARRELGLEGDEDAWPTQWEYLEWARVKRRLARRSGTEVRLPESGSIRAGYGSYAEAVAAARRFLERYG